MKKLFFHSFIVFAALVATHAHAQVVNVDNQSSCDVTLIAVVEDCADWAYTKTVGIPAGTTVLNARDWSDASQWLDPAGNPFGSTIPSTWNWSHMRVSILGGGSDNLGAPTINCLGTFDTPETPASCTSGLLTVTWIAIGSDVLVTIQ